MGLSADQDGIVVTVAALTASSCQTWQDSVSADARPRDSSQCWADPSGLPRRALMRVLAMAGRIFPLLINAVFDQTTIEWE
jgi:hypothetical protein